MRKLKKLLTSMLCMMMVGSSLVVPSMEAYAAELPSDVSVTSVKIIYDPVSYDTSMIMLNTKFSLSDREDEFMPDWNPYDLGATYTAVKDGNTTTIGADVKMMKYLTLADYAGSKIYSSVNGVQSSNYLQISEDGTTVTDSAVSSGSGSTPTVPTDPTTPTTAEEMIQKYNLKAEISGTVAPGKTVSVSVTGDQSEVKGSWEYMWYYDGVEQAYWSGANKTFSIPSDAKGKPLYYQASYRFTTSGEPGYIDVVLTSNTVTIGASGSSTINKIDDSAQDIQYETKNDVINEAYAGTKQSTEVAVSQGAQFSVMIPKKIVLDGSTGSADFAVKVTGDIPGNQKITVAPESETVVLATKGKKDISAGIVQKKTEWSVAEDTQDGLAAGVEEIGYISTKDLSAGTWTGTFNFNIAVEEIAAA